MITLLIIFLAQSTVDNIISTPAVIAAFFGLMGIFGSRVWDSVTQKKTRTQDKVDAAFLNREASMAVERNEFLDEQRVFRKEMTDEVRLLRLEINQLRSENIQLRAENLTLSLNYKEAEKVRAELKLKVAELEKKVLDLNAYNTSHVTQ